MNNITRFFNFCYRNIFIFLCWGIWITLHVLDISLSEQLEPLYILLASAAIFFSMIGCIFSVDHYADELAELLVEPFGSLVLTLSVTAIEVSLMLVIMFSGNQNPSMLRDTVFATLMIMLNGMVGLSLISGGWRHFEQTFNLRGALSFFHLIAPLSLLMLVLPNRTLTTAGPTLDVPQEIFFGGLCVLVYLVFLLMQTTRHKALFNSQVEDGELYSLPSEYHAPEPQVNRQMSISLNSLGLIVSVVPIVLLAEYLGDAINYGIEKVNAPTELAGLIIASLVLAPECLTAFRAAFGNRMQRAVNICLGSALSTIALTVPIMVVVAGFKNIKLILGLPGAGSTLLYATLLTCLITILSGRTTILQGNVHLLLFLTYVFLIFYP
jgi:Ca2+:H+ antiporter